MRKVVGILIVVLALGFGTISGSADTEEPLKKVMIDPGHGGSDPGSVGSGLQEKVLTLKIANLINNHLNNNYDVETKMTRTSDTTVSLKQRTAMANAWGADFFLSTHINAGGGTGYEDYTYNSRKAPSTNVDAESKRIQQITHAEIKKVLEKYNVRDRGTKEANFHVVRETTMPALLTETLFIDHPADASLLRNDNFIRDIAIAHSIGTAKALGLPSKSTSQVPESAPELDVYETTANLRLRSGAGVQHQHLATVEKGTKIAITKTQKVGNVTWGYGKANGKTGWVSMDYMKAINQVSVKPKPVVKPDKPSSKPVFTSSKVLKTGDRGADVGALQKVLNNVGYNLVVDNSFGAATDRAVKDFQRKNGLVADGRPGALTQAKLNQLSTGGTVVKPVSKPVVKPTVKPDKPAGKPVFTSSRVLKNGDRGADVGTLQSVLNNLGYNLVVDNSFGAATDRAVKDFQRKNGLVADGRPGALTQAKLNKLSTGGTVVKPVSKPVVKPAVKPDKPAGKPVFTSSRVLKTGDRGADVGTLQSVLNNLGYNLVVDNSFGAATDRAVKDFQRKNGLVADGRPGALTQAKLNKLSTGGTVVKPVSKPVVKPNKPSGKPVFTSSRVLKSGDSGADVGALQRMLNFFGYKLVVDNRFGPATDKAVKNFQRKNGLVADGRPGALTQAKFK